MTEPAMNDWLMKGRIRDTSPKTTLPKRLFAEKNRRMQHFAEKLFMAYLPNTVKFLILCQDFKI